MNNLLLEYYNSIITDNSETPESISSFVSMNLERLVRAFRKEDADLTSLVNRMVPEDFAGRYGVIRSLIPEFDPELYLKNIPNPEYYWRDLLEDGVDPNQIARAWPRLLTLEQKIDAGVSPNVIVETEGFLDNDDAVELLESGADPDKVAQKADLSLKQMIEFGVNPKPIIRSAMETNADLVRKSIETMFSHGLTTEELIDAEIKSLGYNSFSVYEIPYWYIEHFGLIVEFAEDREGLTNKLMELVEEIYYRSDMPLETGDAIFLAMMQQCVKHGLIDVDGAVDYIVCIHSEPEEDYLERSRLLDEDYVRAELLG